MKTIDRPSPHFNDRKDGKRVSILLLHYTDTLASEDTLRIMHEREVSAHYVVDLDGTVIRVVPEDRRAWHAGKSFWAGEEDINSVSVGIEIQNPGHAYGYRAFPDAQIAAVAALSEGIIARHGIAPHHVLGHSDVCPGRREKPDPGHLFPWQRLAKAGIGLWPGPHAEDFASAQGLLSSEEKITAMLVDYGYDPRVDFRMLMTAFLRHFAPEKFTHWEDHPDYDAEALARLSALRRQK